MRTPLWIAALILLTACSGKSTVEEADIITRLGEITAKEEASREKVSEKGVNTSVYASVSSGGGVSIGIGFLLSKFLSGGSDLAPMRYEVDLVDGDAMTIYHDSRDFEIGDCVEIRVHPDEEKHPPTMRRRKGAC